MEIQFYREQVPEPLECSAEDQAFFDELDRQILEESQKSITAEKNQPKS